MQRQKLFRIAVRRFAPFAQAIRAQWVAFEADAQTGLQLDLVELDLHDLEDALFTRNGMADGTWDVAFVATDWIAAMYARGCAVDLAPLLRDDPPPGYPEGWTESLLRLQRIGEQVLGVPYHDGPECLIYRRDLFAAHGLTPPGTWDDFQRIARVLHEPGRRRYGAIFAAFADGHNSVYDYLLQLWTRGGELFDAHGAIRFQTPEAEAALSYYRALLADEQAVHPECARLDSVAAGLAFAAGEAAMSINWFGFAAMAHTSAESAVRGLVEVAPIPRGPGGTSVSLNVYWILAIAAGSPQRDAAWAFLRHTQSPAMDRLTTLSGAIGCRRSTWSDAEVNAAIPFYHRIETLHAHAREIPRRADWGRIAAVIDALMTAAITSATPAGELLRQADAALGEIV